MNPSDTHCKVMGVAEATCKRCGKRFILAPMHIYKKCKQFKKHHKTFYYCSWTCYLHSDDEEMMEHDEESTTTISRHEA